MKKMHKLLIGCAAMMACAPISIVCAGEVSIDSSTTWDASSSLGIQGGEGAWGWTSYWTNNFGDTRNPWPGSGNNAVFAGSGVTYGSYIPQFYASYKKLCGI